VKKGGGFVAWVMKRFQWAFGDALREEAEKVSIGENEDRWKMVILGSGKQSVGVMDTSSEGFGP
jgi:hypothetical protein